MRQRQNHVAIHRARLMPLVGTHRTTHAAHNSLTALSPLITHSLRSELAHEVGVSHWERVPALNTDVTFIADLADAVIEALPYVGCVAKPGNTALVPMGAWEGVREVPIDVREGM